MATDVRGGTAAGSSARTAQQDLHVTSPPMAGPGVLRIQQKLNSLGYAPGRLDGAYGDATAAAVRRSSATTTSRSTGSSAPTRARCSTPRRSRCSLRRSCARPSSLGQARARRGAPGARERRRAPPARTRTSSAKWFGVDGVPVVQRFRQLLLPHRRSSTRSAPGFKGAGCYAKGCTYVPTTEAWLKATGMWKGRTEPMPGDIAIYNWDGGAPDHIGIVEEYLGNGSFNAIEGNTAVGNDSNGGQVMRRRPLHHQRRRLRTRHPVRDAERRPDARASAHSLAHEETGATQGQSRATAS